MSTSRLLLLGIAVLLGYELLRWAVWRALREWLHRGARRATERRGMRVDPFKFGGRTLVREELLNDLVVTRAMMVAAQAGGRLEEVRRRVEGFLDEIVPAFSLAAYYHLGLSLARAAIFSVYRPVIDQASLQRLSRLPAEATAVFVINHRSNFDYLVVGWALARKVAISYAVGEWARVFPLDALFKAFGGFFVRRGFPDPLYHTVLRRYLQLITRQGVTQGIFLEGGLSRDGALRPPKAGLLDALLQLAAEPGFERKLFFVPVGINYDRVLEDEVLLAELRGRPRPPTAAEKLFGALRLLWVLPAGVAVNTLRALTGRLGRHGYVAVAFGEPVPWDELARERGLQIPEGDEARRAVAKQLAEGLMRRIAPVIPATPVPLVARALLDLGGSATMGDLATRVRLLRAELEAQGVSTALGEEFASQKEGRARLEEDEYRNRDMARLEGDLLGVEEAENIVGLATEHLIRRRVVLVRGERLEIAPTPRARELLAYYARSLAVLPLPDATPAANASLRGA